METSTIKIKTDTTENWESSNRVLELNEPGYERTSDGLVNMKLGDGITPWKELGYVLKGKVTDSESSDASNNTLFVYAKQTGQNAYSTDRSLTEVLAAIAEEKQVIMCFHDKSSKNSFSHAIFESGTPYGAYFSKVRYTEGPTGGTLRVDWYTLTGNALRVSSSKYIYDSIDNPM